MADDGFPDAYGPLAVINPSPMVRFTSSSSFCGVRCSALKFPSAVMTLIKTSLITHEYSSYVNNGTY